MERTWLRLTLRRRWKSLLVLTLLVAATAAFVLASAAGAVRAFTALDRLLTVTLPTDLVVLPNDTEFDWDEVRKLPTVEALTGFGIGAYGATVEKSGERLVEELAFGPTDDEAFRTIEKPVVVSGRMLDPQRLDEVMVTGNFLQTFGVELGDTILIELYKPESVMVLATSDPTAAPDGPTISATIVGVLRSAWYSDEWDGKGAAVMSPAVYQRYEDNIMGIPRFGYENALVRLVHGEDDVEAFTQQLSALTGRDDIEIWKQQDQLASQRTAITFEATTLLALALAAAVAALFLVGQAMARSVASASTELKPLRDIGLGRRRSLVASVLPQALAAGVGMLIGIGGAVLASPIFPIGSASLLEPRPGFDVDLLVLLGGGALLLIVLLAIAVFSAWVAQRAHGSHARRSIVAGWAAKSGLPVPVVVGTRFAFEPGSGNRATPVRPALIGAVAGITGVVAALTLAHGIAEIGDHPERYGNVWQLALFVGSAGQDYMDGDAVLAAVADEPMVDAVNDGAFGVVDYNGSKVTLTTLDPVGASVPFTVVDGRLPESADEVALAPTIARQLDIAVGDTVPLNGAEGGIDARVVGLAFTPWSPHTSYDTGGFVTASTGQTLWGDSYKVRIAQVTLAAGTDVDAAAEAIAVAGTDANGGAPISAMPAPIPTQVIRLGIVGVLPLVLCIFLALLAVASLGHALVTALRRRRFDIAVLRALGLAPWQSGLIALTQATAVAAVGLLFGLPLGIALGRSLWRFVADTTPVEFVDPVLLLLVLGAIPLALLVANLLASWPGRQASRLRIASILRAE